MSAEAEAEVPSGFSAKLKLNFRVPISKLKPCEGQIVPSWSWRLGKNEKWYVHQDFFGNLTLRKIGK
jgi:hypothetical protein